MKKKLICHAIRIAWYLTTNSTFTLLTIFLYKNNCFPCEPGNIAIQDLALHNKRLIVSGMSLTLETNVDRNDGKRPYLSSP